MSKATDWSNEPLILDKDDLVRILNHNANTIYRLFRRQDFPTLQFSKKRYAVTKEALREWLRKESWKNEFINGYKEMSLEEQKRYEHAFNEAYIFIKNKMEDEEKRLKSL